VAGETRAARTYCDVVLVITNASWTSARGEQIFYGEFDGKRRKSVLVKIIDE